MASSREGGAGGPGSLRAPTGARRGGLLIVAYSPTGRRAKLIVVGMTATKFTIADPSDPGMLDVVGFDAAAPRVMADFARG